MRSNRKLEDWQIAEIIRLYPTMKNKDIAEHIGASRSVVEHYRAKLNLRKPKEFISQINRESTIKNEAWRQLNTKESIEARSKTLKELYRVEDIRLRWGLPQKTKIRLRRGSISKDSQRKYLRERGYIIDDATLTAYYTDETNRAPRLEKIPRGVKKGAIKPFYTFKPYKNQP